MARMNSREVSRLFASTPFGQGDAAQSYGALSCAGRWAHSYSAVIAVKVAPGVVVVTSKKWSRTTSRHTSLIRGALAVSGWTIHEVALNSAGLPVECEGGMFPGWPVFLKLEGAEEGTSIPVLRTHGSRY